MAGPGSAGVEGSSAKDSTFLSVRNCPVLHFHEHQGQAGPKPAQELSEYSFCFRLSPRHAKIIPQVGNQT